MEEDFNLSEYLDYKKNVPAYIPKWGELFNKESSEV